MSGFFKCGENILLQMGSDGALCKGENVRVFANSTDAAQEKHVPIAVFESGRVLIRIGSVPHPMTPEHCIEWVYVQTTSGGIFCNLAPEDEPEAMFSLVREEVEAVYIYCNLHGLWKAVEPVFSDMYDTNDVACSAEFAQGCINPLGD